MRLQSFGVIFVLIIVPLILVLSYYLNLQIKTITKQNEYDGDLLAATYDALSSFEINTANEDLSTVSDSLRTIIEASCNVFFNTLSTNLGLSNASKGYVEPYVPALLYTLYDGYYIYAPTKVPTVVTNDEGVVVKVGDPGVERIGEHTYRYNKDSDNVVTYVSFSSEDEAKTDYMQPLYKMDNGLCTTLANLDNSGSSGSTTALPKTKNILKTYMPYSAKYKFGNSLITVVYTLDNFITIEGDVNGIYYTKSGYLIPTDGISVNTWPYTVDLNSDTVTPGALQTDLLLKYSQADAKKYISEGNKVELHLKYSSDEDCIITVGNDPIILSTKKGDMIEKSVRTYLYKDVTDPTKEDDEEYKADPNNFNYYNYDELEIKLVNVKNSYNKAINYRIMNDSGKIEIDSSNKLEIAGIEVTSRNELDELITKLHQKINTIQNILDTASAVQYYIDSCIFSTWVQDTFNSGSNVIQAKDIVEISGMINFTSQKQTDDIIIDFREINDETHIFDLNLADTNSIDAKNFGRYEITKDSPFYSHKLNVIKNSIQYNLNMAMTTYNNITANSYEYEMPILNGSEWEKILTNVSLVSFMQGYSCGLKPYNNYKIVTSTNNELTVKPDDIYYVLENDGTNSYRFDNGESIYHKIDCPKLLEELDNSGLGENATFMSFSSKEVKYDKIYDKTTKSYQYDHKNIACYYCINDKNYEENKTDVFENDDNKSLQRAVYIGIAKERNNLYKMNGFENSQGYQIIFFRPNLTTSSVNELSKLGLDKISSLQITINPLTFEKGTSKSAVSYKVSVGSTLLNENTNSFYTIAYSENISTFQIKVNPEISEATNVSLTETTSNLKFESKDANIGLKVDGTDVTGTDITEAIRKKCLCVKVIYK